MDAFLGAFGKLPSTGDFVARDLPPGVRPVLDRWLTAFQKGSVADDWPADGLRGLIETPASLCLFVAVPSQDSRGRSFPICSTTSGTGLSLESAESWCDTTATLLISAVLNGDNIAMLIETMKKEPLPLPDGADGVPSFWRKGGPPLALDPAQARLQDLPSSG